MNQYLHLLFDYIKVKIGSAARSHPDRSLEYLEGYVDAMLDIQDKVVSLISASQKEDRADK